MGGIVEDFLSNDKGKIIISIIWGLGLAALFRKVCKGRNCIVIKGPKPQELEKIKFFNLRTSVIYMILTATKCQK